MEFRNKAGDVPFKDGFARGWSEFGKTVFEAREWQQPRRYNVERFRKESKAKSERSLAPSF